jgi:hypothetical protein
MTYVPPMKFKAVNLVHDMVLDAYIEEHLGRPWSMQQNGMISQDMLTQWEVWPDRGHGIPERVAAWLASPPANCPGRLDQPGYAESVEIYTDDILKELCHRGLLPEGDMYVHVWW